MKRIAFILFVALIFLFIGMHNSYSQEDAPVDRGHGVFRDMLPDELKNLDIKNYYIASKGRQGGFIQTLTGQVVVLKEDTNQAYFAAPGDSIFKQDTIFTLKASRCRIKFTTEDIITMGDNTRISVDRIVDDHAGKKKKSIISMLRGKAMFYVVRLFRYKKISTTINTPTAVLGVRGTKFGVEVKKISEKTAANMPVYLADNSGSSFLHLAQTGDSDTTTVVYGFDGQVEVYSIADGTTQTVGEGENIQISHVGAGEIQDTDPKVAEQFESETEAPAPAGEETGEEGSGDTNEQGEPDKTGDEESDDEEGDDSSGSTGDDSGMDDTDPSDDVSQTQTEQEIDESSDETWEGMTAGEGSYIAAMITGASGNPDKAWNESNRDPMYISRNPSPFSGGAETHTAYENAHDGDNDYKMVIEEISDPLMNMNVTYFALNTGGDVAVNNYFEWHQGGRYLDENGHEYLTWGWWDWVSGDAFGKVGDDGTNVFYTATGKIWEIEGDFTHEDAISHLQQQNLTATYSGEAKGVYAQSDAANVHILSGAFSCHIDLGVKHISDFQINISGGVNVHLKGGSGALNGDGTFQLNGSSFISAGSTINGSPITGVGENGANGACFGPKAQGVGGIWHAHDGEKWATGEFHGKR
ncbi:MAG: FecR family protein [Thermodesulfobacteriota bacterium]|nr:FecR family protein [Thermodesulfobacteriota bacterium]